jgi:predicted GNAT family acetyltransferase
MAAIDNDTDQVIGVLVHYWHGKIMMQAPDLTILHHLALQLQKSISRPITGIMGDNDQVATVIQVYALQNAEYNCDKLAERYSLQLKDLKLPILHQHVSYEMVNVQKISYDTLVSWLKAYEIESLGAEDNEAFNTHIATRAQRILQSNAYWALLVDGIPVALSGFNARLPQTVQVGPVWTPPAHRNKGYARLLLALTLQQAKTRGVEQATLVTDTPAGIRVYQSLGFEKIGLYRFAILRKPTFIS